MLSGYLREMTLYSQDSEGRPRKTRTIVSSYYRPPASKEVVSNTGFDPSRVFLPNGQFLLYWGLAMIATILYVVLAVPFMVAFDVEDSLPTGIVDFTCSLLYIVDVAVTFNTGFFKNGIFITTRSLIAKRYVRTWLLFDVISAFPIDWVFEQPLSTTSTSSVRETTVLRMVKVGRLLKLLRLVRVVRVKMHLVRVSQKFKSGTLEVIFRAFYLLIVLLGIAHWVACGFFYVSRYTECTESWIYYYSMQDAYLVDQYAAAFYWAITTLTTTGYGDIHPINTSEKVYGVCIMVISAVVFSIVIGKIGASITSVDKDANEHRELTVEVARQLKQAEVSSETIFRAVRYLDYVWETRKKRKVLDRRILGYFSEPLRNEISEHIYGPFIVRVEMFARFEPALILQLARSIATEVFAQEDVIFQAGQTSAILYFIEEGKVEIYDQLSNHTFATLQTNDYFGEIAFFTGSPRCASARCLEFCEMMTISRSSFMSLLTPEAYYVYNVIQDLYGCRKYGELGLFCYICSGDNHTAAECTEARIQINKEKIGKKWMNKRNYRSRVLTPEFKPNFKRKQRKVQRVARYSVDNMKKWMGYTKIKTVDKLFTRTFTEKLGNLGRNPSKRGLIVEVEEPKGTEAVLISEMTTGRGHGDVAISDDSDELPTPAQSLPIPHISKFKQARRKEF